MIIPDERLSKLINDMNDYSIIVEGKKDVLSLSRLRIKNINDISGQNIETFVYKLPKNDKYVVLTDFDREGERKKQKIYKFFDKIKIRFNHNLRLKFRNISRVIKIEEIGKKSILMEDDYNGEISPINNKISNRSRFLRKRSGRKT